MPERDEAGAADESSALALRVIAALLIVGASWVLASILVPFVVALVLAIALSPVADRLERIGLPKVASALACMLMVASFLTLGVGLVGYQAGTMAGDSDRYINRFGSLLDQALAQGWWRASKTTGQAAPAPEGSARSAQEEPSPTPTEGRGVRLVRRFVGAAESWLAAGVGGVLGAIGGAVVFLAFLFYMLHGRADWIEGITAALRRLGLKPSHGQLEEVRDQVVRYVSVLGMVSCCYVVVVSIALWLIGVPQPLLWGVLAGLFEVVPYFGPLIASVLPTVVSLSLGAWWQPMATAGLFLVLHTVEGYVITPLLYGRAVKFDPVTILFGALFFGGLWGPVGLAVATPMLIILRGLLIITPDTPALDALADVKTQKTAARTAAEPVPTGHDHPA